MIFNDVAHAYAAAKAINSVLMSFAAVPAYLLARHVLNRPLALLAALFAITVPSLQYTGTIMTENAFYPAFLICALAFVRMLARPTVLRQLLALAAIVLAFLIRAQAVLFVPALVTAVLMLVVVEARAAGELQRRGVSCEAWTRSVPPASRWRRAWWFSPGWSLRGAAR